MMYRAILIALIAVAFSFSVSVSVPAAHADELLSGTASVRGKNTRNMRVQLGERQFKVTSASVIRDGSGSRIKLADLEVPDLGRGGVDLMLSPVVGRYTATRKGHSLILDSLDLELNAK